MFFVLIFLILSATTSYLFPEWSWATVLLVSLGCLAVLRILLAVTSRSGDASSKAD
jgi:phage-related holin